MSAVNPTCDTCRFWQFVAKDENGCDTGECRRSAPMPMPLPLAILIDAIREGGLPALAEAKQVPDNTDVMWARYPMHPTVHDDFWCGEYRQRGTRSRFGEVDAGFV